ncbi:g7651 [Coccomyxa viridis]|uniref:G7651 protein n=1 Tax=Coccomyxa viridis TaxID=1274662 RepID=A0ABP1FZK0_9CHLO
MLDPKTPFQAAAIFLGGVAVIAYTVLDINRTTRMNEKPMSPEQLHQLQQMAKDIQSRPVDPLQQLENIVRKE